jgi:putative inorganic carbon (HCO3(-)) transporter
MATGLLTYFITPLYLPILVAFLIAGVIIFAIPESGIVLLLGLTPFFSVLPYPSVLLLLGLLAVGFSYLLKLIAGKRVFRLRLTDLAVLLFGALILFGGIVSVGGEDSFRAAMLSFGLLLGYFLIVNLLRTPVWIGRSVAMLVVSGVFSALYGIWQYFTADVGLQWLDTEMFTNISGRATGPFDNANVFSVFLVLLLPYALQFFVRAGEVRRGMVYGFGCCLLMAALVLTWSRGAWLGALAALLLFFLFVSRRTVNWLLLGALTLPVWVYVLPENILQRFLSIGNLRDSSTHYRYYLWQGVFDALREHWFGGIGYGESAFQTVYPLYAYPGIESAPHAHQLFLQILLCLGIGGMLAFLWVVYLFAKESLGYLRNPVNRVSGLYTAAGFSAVVGALVIGMTDYIWYNNRLFFLFWAVLALTVASVRAGEEERKKATPYYENSDTQADLDLPVEESSQN